MYLRESKQRRADGSTVTFTPAEAAARSDYLRAASRIEDGEELVLMLQRRRANIASPVELERARQLERQDQDAFERFFTETEKFRRAAGGDAPQIRNLELLMESLRSLGPGSIVLQYVVLPDQLRILLTTSSAQKSFVVRVAQEDLYRATRRFRRSLTDESAEVLEASKALHGLLMPAPLAAQLMTLQASTVMVSLDGALRYVPMAALHDGKEFLIEKFAVVGYTIASDIKLLQLPIHPWRVSAFGMTQAASGFKPLGSVQGEIDRIVRDGRGRAWFDSQFTREALMDAVAQEPPVLHIASHFSFAPGSEDDSFLLLGDGKHLSIGDLKQFQFSKMDLLTLSACETAVGGGLNQNGREIAGLAAVVQRRGSASVLATLWSVDDVSTALLMGDFYEARDQQVPVSKAAALRAAQRRLASLKRSEMQPSQLSRRGTVESASPVRPFDAERPYAHPFYWAPFTLIGNWR